MLNPFKSASGWQPLTIELFGCQHSAVDSTPAVTLVDRHVEVSTLHDCVFVAGLDIEIGRVRENNDTYFRTHLANAKTQAAFLSE